VSDSELGSRVRRDGLDMGEASRQLEQATHDTRVAFDCIALDELDRAHTHAITARAAVDAALTILQVVLDDASRDAPPTI
jgi:hypothetical protein